MYVTKTSLSRRTVLRGMGAAVALPLLDAMVPALTATQKTAANPKLRFGAVYIPNGTILGSPQFTDMWTPSTAGTGFEFSPILKPLEPMKDRVVVVSNLSRRGEDNHAVSAAAWLSSVVAKRTEAEDVRLGTTADQIVARQIGQDTPLPSLELATENFEGYVGACSVGYSCAYMNTISWASPTAPLPMEINPRVVFERLFGRAGTPQERQAQMREDRSILDSISEEAQDLKRSLGVQDGQRVTEYLDHVREIERRIQRTEAQNSTQVSVDAPVGVPELFADHVNLMFDLLAVAYQTEMTRVFTFMMAREASFKTYPEIGVTEPHHPISHHGNKPEVIAQVAKINIHHMQLFARFLEKLRATPDGDGSLLDHSLIFYGSGMGNGNAHGSDPLPLVAVGGGVGKGHRHIQGAPHTPLGNLWVSVVGTFGAEMTSFGDSTGRLEI